MKWIFKNKKWIIIGFIFGAVIAPLLATLGLIFPFFEQIRPLLMVQWTLLVVLYRISRADQILTIPLFTNGF